MLNPKIGLCKKHVTIDENYITVNEHLIIRKIGGGKYVDDHVSGLYLHPNLIINLAEYINPDFEDLMIELTKEHLVKLELSKKEKLIAELKHKNTELNIIKKDKDSLLQKMDDMMKLFDEKFQRQDEKLEAYGNKVLQIVTKMSLELKKTFT